MLLLKADKNNCCLWEVACHTLKITCLLQLKNLSAMEVNIVRPFMVRALQAFYKHDSPEMIQQPRTIGSRRPHVADRGPRVSWFAFSEVVIYKQTTPVMLGRS